MKPIIIYAEEKDDDDKVTITKAELQRVVDEAYRQGKADGNWYTTNPITVTPTMRAFGVNRCLPMIDEVPSADVRENVRGKWIHDEITRNGNTVYTPNAKCSICDCYVFQESNFCPNCGADMRGGQNDMR